MNDTIKSIIDQQFQEYPKYREGSDTLLDKEDIILSYNKDESNIHISALSELSYGCEHRLQLLLPYIQEYIKEYRPKSFDLIICLGDIIKHQYSLPSICFSRPKIINSILIPNIDLFTGVIQYFSRQVDDYDLDFQLKLDKAIFIGNTTGPLKNNTRILFCEKAQKVTEIESYICGLCQENGESWIQEYPTIKSYIHPMISVPDQLKYKVVINIDGNTVCWSRLYWQMKSNSIPLYINKTQSEIQFFDYIDHSSTYITCSLDESIDIINTIIKYPTEKIQEINNAGKRYFNLCFNNYINNPHQFLTNIINSILYKISI